MDFGFLSYLLLFLLLLFFGRCSCFLLFFYEQGSSKKTSFLKQNEAQSVRAKSTHKGVN